MASPQDADHEIWVFDGNELLDELKALSAKAADRGIKINEQVRENIDADIIAISLFLRSAGQTVQQIRLLGVMGQAYHKLGNNGRKYLIFKGNARLRPNLAGTRYLASNPKVACFVVGGREIIRDAGTATKIAVIALVAYDIIREFREDRFSLASLGVRILSDVLQAAGSAAVSAAVGVVLATAGAPVVATFAIVVGVGFLAGMAFAEIDRRFELTERARRYMMEYESQMAERLRSDAREIEGGVRWGMQIVEDVRLAAGTVRRFWRTIEEYRNLGFSLR